MTKKIINRFFLLIFCIQLCNQPLSYAMDYSSFQKDIAKKPDLTLYSPVAMTVRDLFTYSTVNTGISLFDILKQQTIQVGSTAILQYSIKKLMEVSEGYKTKVKDWYIPKQDTTFAIPSEGALRWFLMLENRIQKPKTLWQVYKERNDSKYQDFGHDLPPGIMAYGLPGTGKTTVAEKIAGRLQIPFVALKGNDFTTKIFVGSDSVAFDDIFKELNHLAEEKGDTLVLIDEADSLGSRDNQSALHNHNGINNFLDAIPHRLSPKVHLFFATNYLARIDPALFREGRLELVKFGLPGPKTRLKILKSQARSRIMYKSAYELLPKLAYYYTCGFTAAQLGSLINEATGLAEREANHIPPIEPDKEIYEIDRDTSSLTIRNNIVSLSGEKGKGKEKESSTDDEQKIQEVDLTSQTDQDQSGSEQASSSNSHSNLTDNQKLKGVGIPHLQKRLLEMIPDRIKDIEKQIVQKKKEIKDLQDGGYDSGTIDFAEDELSKLLTNKLALEHSKTIVTCSLNNYIFDYDEPLFDFEAHEGAVGNKPSRCSKFIKQKYTYYMKPLIKPGLYSLKKVFNSYPAYGFYVTSAVALGWYLRNNYFDRNITVPLWAAGLLSVPVKIQ